MKTEEHTARALEAEIERVTNGGPDAALDCVRLSLQDAARIRQAFATLPPADAGLVEALKAADRATLKDDLGFRLAVRAIIAKTEHAAALSGQEGAVVGEGMVSTVRDVLVEQFGQSDFMEIPDVAEKYTAAALAIVGRIQSEIFTMSATLRPEPAADDGLVERVDWIMGGVELAMRLLQDHAGAQTSVGDAYKVLDSLAAIKRDRLTTLRNNGND